MLCCAHFVARVRFDCGNQEGSLYLRHVHKTKASPAEHGRRSDGPGLRSSSDWMSPCKCLACCQLHRLTWTVSEEKIHLGFERQL